MQIGNSVLSLSMVESTKRSELTWYKGTWVQEFTFRRTAQVQDDWVDFAISIRTIVNRGLASFVLTKLRAVRPQCFRQAEVCSLRISHLS